jgi:hypothetical protein
MKNKLEDYLGNIDDFKEKIAMMCINLTGTMEQEYNVLLRFVRGYGLSLEYRKDGDDGYNNHDRFGWVFPMFFWRDMPSGYNIGDETEDGWYYELLDENGKFLQEINKNDLMRELVDDLVERNYNEFNQDWVDFLTAFQKWIDEEETK